MVNSPNPFGQEVPETAVTSGGVVYVAWVQLDNNGGDDIYFAKSVDGGRSFGCETRVNDDAVNASQTYPSIAIGPNESVHIAWRDYRNDQDREFVPGGGVDGINDPDIYYSKSEDGGATFSLNVKVNDGVGDFQTTHMHRFIGVDHDGKIHVVWTDDRKGKADIYYANSTDGGLAFNPNIRVSDGNGSASEPSLAVDSEGIIHVVWMDSRNESAGTRIFYSRSQDGGESFGRNVMIDSSTGTLAQHNSEIAVSGSVVGVVWDDPYSRRVYSSVSCDGGDSFSEPKPVSDSGLVLELAPSIALNDSGYIAVAWMDKRTSDFDIYFSDSYNFGETFGASVRVNDDATSQSQHQPSLATDGNGYAYVVWMDYRSGTDWDVYFARSPSGLADLTITSSDILFSDGDLVPYGTQMKVNATIWNYGDANASDVRIDFFDGQPGEGELIGSDSIPFIEMTGGQGYAEVSWLAVEPQFHEICVFADPENSVTESDETNNTACRSIEVVVPPIPDPPGNLTARLSGNGFPNVTLEWSLSPDDGGSINVTRYNIYRNQSHDTTRRGYQLIGSVPNGTWKYTDENAGEGDPDNHFYYVCAIGDMNVSSCTADQAGKFTRPLGEGPNLVSVPLIQSNESIEYVLQTVEYDKAWIYDSSSWEWKWYMKDKDYRRGLWTINHTTGLWINVRENCNLTVAGKVPAQTNIHLYEGWNLVSFPSFNSSYSVSDIHLEMASTRVEGYDSLPPYYLRVLGDPEVLQAGYGYWVKVEADVVWVVDIE